MSIRQESSTYSFELTFVSLKGILRETFLKASYEERF